MNDVSLFQENALKPRFGREKRNRQAAEQIAINAKCNRHKAFFDIVGLELKIQKKRVKIITNDNFVVSLHCNT